KLYARGFYGELPAPIDPNVLDRILAGGPTEPLDPAAADGEPVLPKLRAQNPFVSDEELILRIFYDPATLEAYRKAVVPFDMRTVVNTPLAALVEAGLRGKPGRALSVRVP